MTCYLGVQAGNLLAAFTGIELPWWLITAVMLLIVGLLGYRKIDLSAQVLGVVLVLEIIAVVALDVGVLASGRELTAAPFSLTEALSGAPGLGLLFALLGFFGFEAPAVFRGEARDPLRTIPRATYIAVLLIGVLYTVSSWLVVSGLGEGRAVAASVADPDGVIVALAREVVGPIVADVVQVLVVTSMFACMLAFHNIVTRYLFTLGRRGVLPVSLGAVHPTRRAPSHASLWVSGLTTAIVLVSVVAMLDPVTQIYTWYSGAGAVGVILMMALTSVAVVRFGSSGPDSAAGADGVTRADGVAGAGGSAVADGSAGTGGPGGRAPVAVLLATGLGGLGLIGVLALSLANFPLLVGGTSVAVVCGAILVVVFTAGFLVPSRGLDSKAGAEVGSLDRS